MDNDISTISKNIGWDYSSINQIKNHLFIEDHLFEDGSTQKFDPDYEIAMAWLRLLQGIQTETDILLLNHELYESSYMKALNCNYELAHTEANKNYNWQEVVYPD